MAMVSEKIHSNKFEFLKIMNEILVVLIAGIGDLVMATPALIALRNRFKDKRISILTIPRSAEIIQGAPYIDEIFTLNIDFTDFKSIFDMITQRQTWRLIKILRKKKFDILINLQALDTFIGTLEMMLLFWLIGGKYKVGRDTHSRGFFYDLKIEEKREKNKHEVDMNLEVVKLLGAEINNTKLEVYTSDEDEKVVFNLFTQYNINIDTLLVGLNPGAFRPSRRWVTERWAQVADKIVEEYKAKIIITGSGSEKEMVQELANLMKFSPIIVAGKLSIKQLAVLVKRLNLFITNDTGPMHIAVAMRIPLVALFGPGDVYRIGPYGQDCKRQLVIRKEIDCIRPCYKFSCNDMRCMNEISVGDVMNAVRDLLGKMP